METHGEYGTEIEYIQGKKNIVIDALSRWPKYWDQNTTHGVEPNVNGSCNGVL